MRRPLFYPWSASLFALLMALAPFCLAEEPSNLSKRAVFRVRLPADAELLIDGKKTTQTGSLRRFFSPPLDPKKSYHYVLKWSYRNKEGKLAKGEKTVNVQAGDDKLIDLLAEKGGGNSTPADLEDEDGKRKNKKPGDKTGSGLSPLPRQIVDKLFDLAALKQSDVVYDLGCGDGRLVIRAADSGCKAFGFDNDKDNVIEAEKKAKTHSVENLVTVAKQNVFEVDLKPASVVLLHLGADANNKLVPHLKNLKPGTRIISVDAGIEDYEPKKKESVRTDDNKTHHVYLFEAPLMKK